MGALDRVIRGHHQEGLPAALGLDGVSYQFVRFDDHFVDDGEESVGHLAHYVDGTGRCAWFVLDARQVNRYCRRFKVPLEDCLEATMAHEYAHAYLEANTVKLGHNREERWAEDFAQEWLRHRDVDRAVALLKRRASKKLSKTTGARPESPYEHPVARPQRPEAAIMPRSPGMTNEELEAALQEVPRYARLPAIYAMLRVARPVIIDLHRRLVEAGLVQERWTDLQGVRVIPGPDFLTSAVLDAVRSRLETGRILPGIGALRNDVDWFWERLANGIVTGETLFLGHDPQGEWILREVTAEDEALADVMMDILWVLGQSLEWVHRVPSGLPAYAVTGAAHMLREPLRFVGYEEESINAGFWQAVRDMLAFRDPELIEPPTSRTVGGPDYGELWQSIHRGQPTLVTEVRDVRALARRYREMFREPDWSWYGTEGHHDVLNRGGAALEFDDLPLQLRALAMLSLLELVLPVLNTEVPEWDRQLAVASQEEGTATLLAVLRQIAAGEITEADIEYADIVEWGRFFDQAEEVGNRAEWPDRAIDALAVLQLVPYGISYILFPGPHLITTANALTRRAQRVLLPESRNDPDPDIQTAWIGRFLQRLPAREGVNVPLGWYKTVGARQDYEQIRKRLSPEGGRYSGMNSHGCQ